MSLQRTSVAVVHDNFLALAGLTSTFAACDDLVVQTLAPGDAALLCCDVVVADLESGLHALNLARRLPLGASAARTCVTLRSVGGSNRSGCPSW